MLQRSDSKRQWADIHDSDSSQGERSFKRRSSSSLRIMSMDSYCETERSFDGLSQLKDLRISEEAVLSLDSHYSHLSTQDSFEDPILPFSFDQHVVPVYIPCPITCVSAEGCVDSIPFISTLSLVPGQIPDANRLPEPGLCNEEQGRQVEAAPTASPSKRWKAQTLTPSPERLPALVEVPARRRRRIKRKSAPAQDDMERQPVSKTDAERLTMAADSGAAEQAPPPPLPNECEAEWLERLERRQRAVMIVKASDEYQACLQQGGPRPPTPDPMNRALSKRQWEGQVMQWRLGLRPDTVQAKD